MLAPTVGNTDSDAFERGIGAQPIAPRLMRVIVTGGGTGGHTTPAVATIQAIRELADRDRRQVEFAYLGSKHGMESAAATELGVRFIGIETGKLRRSHNPIGLLSGQNLRDAMRVPVGYCQALKAVRSFKPDVVLSTGGYVSVPGVLAAAALRVPVAAHEQTVQVGLANKINFSVATRIALSVDETLAALPAKQRRKAVVTGNPVREAVLSGDPIRAARRFGLDPAEDGMPVVYVTGGAQGSRLINRAVEESLPTLLELGRVVHQCGEQSGSEQDFDRLEMSRKALPEHLRGRYAVTKFVGPEIGDVYALASLVVGRSGAGTVTEVCALGKPALFVPLVPTGGDEQTRNAKRLLDAGAASVIRQDDLTGDALFASVQRLLGDPNGLADMGRAALSLARPAAAVKLAELVIGLCGAIDG
jgi:UDP-N-acetylglucosamine--N-acetylmuramyl-(pentapeptide) pyrophosphoryl-undecaprenol N-acetylglucosamine transferase